MHAPSGAHGFGSCCISGDRPHRRAPPSRRCSRRGASRWSERANALARSVPGWLTRSRRAPADLTSISSTRAIRVSATGRALDRSTRSRVRSTSCFSGVPDASVESAMSAAAKRGDRSAVIFGGAFEPGSPDGKPTRAGVTPLRERIASIANDAGMALCGAGCMGFVNVARGLRGHRLRGARPDSARTDRSRQLLGFCVLCDAPHAQTLRLDCRDLIGPGARHVGGVVSRLRPVDPGDQGCSSRARNDARADRSSRRARARQHPVVSLSSVSPSVAPRPARRW